MKGIFYMPVHDNARVGGVLVIMMGPVNVPEPIPESVPRLTIIGASQW